MKVRISVILLLSCSLLVSFCEACTGIRLTTLDGSVIYARTLEWRSDLNSKIVVVPRGISYQGTSGMGLPGLAWITKHAYVGINVFNYPYVIDGLNVNGLAVGLFDFHNNIRYNNQTDDRHRDVAPWEFVSYLLGNCASVDEVKEAIKSIKVVPVVMPEISEVPSLHYIVHDVTGQCIVLEHIDHEIKVHGNELGVFTNSPSFDWHLTNVNTYFKRSHINADSLREGYNKKKLLGHEPDIPGGFHSPERFIQATIYTRWAPLVITSVEGVAQAFHILNQFDIPRGVVRGVSSDATMTHWTSAADLKNKQYYFRTYKNQRIREIDLMSFDLQAPNITFINMDEAEDILRIKPS